MERKENDLMMNVVANPNFTMEDFALIGLNVNNTSLQDINTYKSDPTIQNTFSKNGKFDEKLFNDNYNKALVGFHIMSSEDLLEKLKKQLVFHRDNIFAPLEQRSKSPDFKQVIVPNPDKLSSSLIRLGETEKRYKSIDELAQTNKVLLNPKEVEQGKEAKWGTDPNHGFFDYFFNTLVMAQWDEDGTHVDPITGEEVEHKKGDLKINDEGTYYYEKLDGRTVYNRRVLNKMNILTEDGSKWNKYDFFDSDDIEQKSAMGTTMKNLALVGTMFIPYVGPWITGLSLVPQLVGLMGTIGKMATMNSNNSVFSEMEGWGKSLNRQEAKSEYAMNNTWCLENFIGLVGDVAGLLKEQRFFFEKMPALFKGKYAGSLKAYDKQLASFFESEKAVTEKTIAKLAKDPNISLLEKLRAATELNANATFNAQAKMDSWIKGYNKIGEIFSKGYMTAITVGDTYGEAKNAGATDLEATMLTLGYAAGEYAILNTGIGEWILPELRADKYKNKAIVKALAGLDKLSKEALTEEGKQSFVRKLFNIGKNIAKAEYANGTRTLTASLAAGVGEGVEEVSEELLADFSKGCFNTIEWLRGKNTRMSSFGFNWDEEGNRSWNGKEVLDRYGMSLVGGFVGGSLTNLGTNYRMGKSYQGMTSEQAIREITYMARNNELDELYKTVDKMPLFDSRKAVNKVKEIDGLLVVAPGTDTDNQEVIGKNMIKRLIKMIDNIIKANGANLSDDTFLSKQTLQDLRFQALHKASTAGLFMEEFNSLSAKVVELTNSINNYTNNLVDSNKDGKISDREARIAKLSDDDKRALKEKEQELKETQKQLLDLIDGKRADDFVGVTLFEMTPGLSNLPISFPLFAETIAKKPYKDISESQLNKLREEYNNWKQTEGKNLIWKAYQIYKRMAEQASDTLKSSETTYLNRPEQIRQIDLKITSLYEMLANSNLDNVDNNAWLNAAQINTNLDTLLSRLAPVVLSDKFKRLKKGIQTKLNNLKTVEELRKLFADDPTKLEEELKLRILDVDNIRKEYNENLLEMIAEEIESYIQPIIDLGFANTETKNQLLRLLNPIKDDIAKKFEIKNIELEESWSDEENPYQEPLIKLNNLSNKLENLAETPFEVNLNQFAILMGVDPINISLLLGKLNIIFNKSDKDINNFNADDIYMQELDNAISIIQMYQSAINGAKTDNAGLSNLFGYNATLNEVATKLGKETKLAEINSNYANIVNEDINVNLNKLKFLRNLYTATLGQKMVKQDKVAIKKDTLLYKAIRKIIDVPDNDELRTIFGEDLKTLESVINSLTKLNDITEKELYALSLEEKEAFEKDKITMENAIFDFFLKNLDIDKIQKIISKFDVYTDSDEVLLNEKIDELDGPSIIWYLASRAAVKSEDFYFAYKNILNQDSNIAPIATLEMAVYNNYSNVVNGDVISLFYKAYRKHIKEDWKNKTIDDRVKILQKLGYPDKSAIKFSDEKFSDYCFNFLPVSKYLNVTLVEGAPGTGKTSSVVSMTLKMLSQHPGILDKVFVVHGANGKSANKLKDDLGITGEAFGHDDFLKAILTNYKPFIYEDNICKVEEGTYEINKEDNELRGTFTPSITNIPSLIIIDEVSKFNAYEMDAIDKFARDNGITVITSGDFDLEGVSGTHPTKFGTENIKSITVALERNLFSHTPKLGVSMRTDNVILTDNIARFQIYMNSNNFDLNCELEWFENESGLYGHKVYTDSDLETIKEEVKKMINSLTSEEKANCLDPTKPKSIGFICTDKDSQIYKYLKDTAGFKEYIDFNEGGSAQGLEAKYYITDLSKINFDKNNPKDYMRTVYTGLSRCIQGGLLIKKSVNSSDIPHAKIYHSPNSVPKLIKEPLGLQTITKYTKDRKEILDRLIKGKLPEFKARTKEAGKVEDKIDDVSDSNEDGLEDGTTSGTGVGTNTNTDENIDEDTDEKDDEKPEEEDTYEARHKKYVDMYVGKTFGKPGTSGYHVDGTIIDGTGTLRLISELSELDPNATSETDGKWFLPGEKLRIKDREGNEHEVIVTRLYNNGACVIEGWGEPGPLLKSTIKNYFKSENNSNANMSIIWSERYGDRIEKKPEKGITPDSAIELEEQIQSLNEKVSKIYSELGIYSEIARQTINNSDNKIEGGLTLDNLPSIAGSVDSHGIAKGRELNYLLNLLTNGINKSKRSGSIEGMLHTAPLANTTGVHTGATASGTSYRDGLFIVCSEPGKDLNKDGIHTVLINPMTFSVSVDSLQLDTAYKLKAKLLLLFPNINFLLYNEAPDYYKNLELKKNPEPKKTETPPNLPVKVGDKVTNTDYNEDWEVIEIKNNGTDWLIRFKKPDGAFVNITIDHFKLKLSEGLYSLITPKSKSPDDIDFDFMNEKGGVINTVKTEEGYKKALDSINEDKTDDIHVDTEKKVYELNLFLHSFNSFELGVRVDDEGRIIWDEEAIAWREERIDSINGLWKLDDMFDPKANRDLNTYKRKLGHIRSRIFNATNKSELENDLKQLLKIKDKPLYIDFAFKTTPNPTDGTRNTTGNYVASNPDMYGKHRDEKTISNNSSDSRSSEINWHNFVAIIGLKNKNGLKNDMLEIPLFSLSSFLTIIQKVDENGTIIFPELKTIYDANIKDGKPIKNINNIVEELRVESEKHPEYKSITNMIKLFLMTYNGLFRINDNEWLPSKNLENLGPQFVIRKGDYHLSKGMDFDSTTDNWVDISKFAEDPQVRVTPIFKSNRGIVNIDGKDVKLFKPGHPFILISYDTKINSNKDIILLYYRLQSSEYKGIEKVKRVYIMPPEVELEQYLDYIHKVVTLNSDERKKLVPIANSHMAYNILKNVINDEKFLKIAENRLPLLKYLIEYINKIKEAEQNATPESRTTIVDEELKKKVPVGYDSKGLPVDLKIQVNTYLHRMLNVLVYDSNTTLLDLTKGTLSKINQEVVNIIKDSLKTLGKKLFYDIKPDPNSSRNIAGLMMCKQGEKWTIDGKPCLINGKIDSYMFRGNIDSLIEEWVNSIYKVTFKSGNEGKRVKGLGYLTTNLSESEPDIALKTHSYKLFNLVYNKLLKLSKIPNIDSDLIQKIIIEESQNIDPTTYSESDLNETLNRIVRKINSDKNGVFAIKVGVDIFYSTDEMFKDAVVILQDPNTNLDITELVLDSWGIASANYYKDGLLGTIEYKEGIITFNEPKPEIIEKTLSITEDNKIEYMDNIKEILEVVKNISDSILGLPNSFGRMGAYKRMYENIESYKNETPETIKRKFMPSDKIINCFEYIINNINNYPNLLSKLNLLNEILEYIKYRINSRPLNKTLPDEVTCNITPIKIKLI